MIKKLRSTFQENTCYQTFFISLILTGLSYGIFKGLIDNYFAEIVSMTEFDRGVAEFFRELPGLLLVFILAVFYSYTAEKIYKIGSAIVFIGIALLFAVPPTKILVITAVFIHSLGEHIQLGMRSALALTYSKPEKGGEALGHTNAMNQIGTLAGYLVIIAAFFFLNFTSAMYKPFFLAAAVLMLIAFIYTLRLSSDTVPSKNTKKFYFKKKFYKFYMLEVFYGARKQVFFTFGPYVLILLYGANAQIISLLFALSAIACFFLSPLVGRIIDRFGYKIVMISDTLILVIVCFFYGFSHHLFPKDVAFIVCCVNYILDSVISLASMASNVYVQDISDSPEEVRATISTGLSVNHLITILIALFGGMIWQVLGVETLFILSAILGIGNSIYAATIKTGAQLRSEGNL